MQQNCFKIKYYVCVHQNKCLLVYIKTSMSTLRGSKLARFLSMMFPALLILVRQVLTYDHQLTLSVMLLELVTCYIQLLNVRLQFSITTAIQAMTCCWRYRLNRKEDLRHTDTQTVHYLPRVFFFLSINFFHYICFETGS